MRLYLVQHGEARTEDEDPERPLTDRGLDDVGRVARHAVERAGVRASRVLHSGKTRARETAEVWGRLLHVPVEPADALAPNDDPAIWAERVDAAGEDLILVGHLPHLARLAGRLLTGASSPSLIRFHQGGLVGLDRADPGWAIAVVLPPGLA